MSRSTPGRPHEAPVANSRRRLILGVPLIGALLALVAAAPASASFTVGSSSLGAAGAGQVVCTAAPCVLIQDQINGAIVATPAGVITSWSVRNAAGTIALRVLRQRGSLVAGELHATNISEGQDRDGANADVIQTFPTRQPVANGDYIGITLQSGSYIGAYAGSGDDDLFEVPGSLSLADVDDTSADQFEQLVQAKVEPDADGDGYGDESQDGCPGNASTAGACPAAPQPTPPGPTPTPDPFASVRTVGPKTTLSPRSPRISKNGSVTLTVANGAPVAIKGKVKLSSALAKLAAKKTIVIGSKSFSISAGGRATVKIKLSKKARRALRRKKRLPVTAVTTAKAAQGKGSRRKTKLTLRRYKRSAAKPPSTPGGTDIHWKGRNLERSEALGSFTFSLQSGSITLEKLPLVKVTCFELGGPGRTAFSFESFAAKGPYPLGGEKEITQQGSSLNTLVNPQQRDMRYTMKSSRSGDKITGELTIGYSGYHVGVYGDSYIVKCTGTDRFRGGSGLRRPGTHLSSVSPSER
jgi:hypothetical protein